MRPFSLSFSHLNLSLSRTLSLSLSLSSVFFCLAGYRTEPILYVNGRKVPSYLAQRARSNQTLIDFLRSVLNFTGTKLGCAEGGCGACTVMLSKVVVAKKDSDSSMTAKDRIKYVRTRINKRDLNGRLWSCLTSTRSP